MGIETFVVPESKMHTFTEGHFRDKWDLCLSSSNIQHWSGRNYM